LFVKYNLKRYLRMTDQVQEGALPVAEAEELAVPQVLEAEEEVQQPSTALMSY
jgi:hypothetical protein